METSNQAKLLKNELNMLLQSAKSLTDKVSMLTSQVSMLMDLIEARKRNITPEETAKREAAFIMKSDIICEIIATKCKTSVDLMKSKSRKGSAMEGRKVAYFVMRQVLTAAVPLRKIGAYLGGRDHSTVMHGIDSMEDIILTEPHTKRIVNEVLAVAKYQIRLI